MRKQTLRRVDNRRVPTSGRFAVSPQLAKPLQAALDAVQANDLVLALRYFGECAAIDPLNKAVLYFGSDAAQRAYFSLRYREDAESPEKLDQWRHAAFTLTAACHEADPADPVAVHNTGRFLDDDGQHEAAISWYRKALELKRSQVASWGNLGTCLYTLGKTEEAEVAWSRAVAFDAENPADRMTQGFIWLRRGDYLRGWPALNARWEDQTFNDQYGRKDLLGKPWTGQPLKKTDRLLVHGEQGLGDHVQFARYVPELIARGFKVAGLETRGPLKRWFEAALPGLPIVVRDKEKLPKYTHHVPMMSLPGLLGLEEIPPPLAHVDIGKQCIDNALNLEERRKQDGSSTLRIGLIWKGTAGNPVDDKRSIPDDQLQHLADIPGVTWVPLQYDPTGTADMTARSWLGANVEPTPTYTDVLALAEIMAGLDAVVAVDTLGAHVAGSLGVPLYLLHRHNREWRWQQYSEATAWYPSAVQLTQPAPGDWETVLQDVRRRLSGGRSP